MAISLKIHYNHKILSLWLVLMMSKNIMRELREQQGLTQAELAEKIGLTPNGYAKIERNETTPQAESIKRIAQALGVSMDTLMNGDKENKNIIILSDNKMTEHSVTIGIKNVNCNDDEYKNQIDLLKQIIEEKEKRIKNLEEIIELLKNKL